MNTRQIATTPLAVLLIGVLSGPVVVAHEASDAPATLATPAIAYTIASPDVAPQSPDLDAVLEAAHRTVFASLQHTTQTLFHTPLQPRAPRPSSAYDQLADTVSDDPSRMPDLDPEALRQN